jgi:hypothetical protein
MILGKYPVKWVAAIGGGLLLFLLLILVIVIFKGNSSPSYNPGESFVIPKGGNTNDLSFLKGCWEFDANLVEETETLSGTYVLCLNDKGTGSASVKEYDDSGRHISTCTSTVTASRKGDTVVIRDPGPICGDESEYSPITFRCVNGLGKSSQCTCQSGDDPSVDISFTYQGKS